MTVYRARLAFAISIGTVLTLLLATIPGPARAAVAIGGDFLVNSYTLGDQRFPVIGMDDNGDFVVVWQDDALDGDTFGIFARRFASSGAAIGQQFQVNTYTSSQQFRPAIASQSNGDFVVAWMSFGQDGSARGLFGRQFTSTGIAQSVEFQINAATLSGQSNPQVATTDANGFVVAWQSIPADSGSYGVIARRFSSSGSPLATQFLVNTYTTANQNYPVVAMLETGEFVVAWESDEQDGFGAGLFAQRFSNAGLAVGAEVQVNAFTSGEESRPVIGIDDAGTAVIVWHSTRTGDFDVFARQLSESSGALIGGEFQVNSYTNSFQRDADIEVRPAGDFMVTWNSFEQDGSFYGVFARRFSPAAVEIEPEFRVNLVSTNHQLYPAAATETNGDFVVVWASVVQDGSLTGIFGRSFKGQLADADGNGIVDPLADGILILRFLFGFTGTSLESGAVDEVGCTRCDATAIQAYLDALGLLLDVDGDGELDAVTDGLLLVRWLFGFTGATLVSGVFDEDDCTRCDAAALTGYLETLGP